MLNKIITGLVVHRIVFNLLIDLKKCIDITRVRGRLHTATNIIIVKLSLNPSHPQGSCCLELRMQSLQHTKYPLNILSACSLCLGKKMRFLIFRSLMVLTNIDHGG